MVLLELAVGPDVLGKVVAAHELLVALRTLEALFAGVRPAVPLQLIGPGEPLTAVHPRADEGPFTRVPPKMGPQVGRFAVHLVASADVADVLLLAVRRTFALGFAVGTRAGNPTDAGFWNLLVVLLLRVLVGSGSSGRSADVVGDADVHVDRSGLVVLGGGVDDFALDLMVMGGGGGRRRG